MYSVLTSFLRKSIDSSVGLKNSPAHSETVILVANNKWSCMTAVFPPYTWSQVIAAAVKSGSYSSGFPQYVCTWDSQAWGHVLRFIHSFWIQNRLSGSRDPFCSFICFVICLCSTSASFFLCFCWLMSYFPFLNIPILLFFPSALTHTWCCVCLSLFPNNNNWLSVTHVEIWAGTVPEVPHCSLHYSVCLSSVLSKSHTTWSHLI